MDYERLIRQADQTPFEGWDFGVFRGRFVEAEPSWEFSKLLRTLIQRSSSMLDLGTGGGEFLKSGTPLKVNGHRFLVIARSKWWVSRQEAEPRSGERPARF